MFGAVVAFTYFSRHPPCLAPLNSQAAHPFLAGQAEAVSSPAACIPPRSRLGPDPARESQTHQERAVPPSGSTARKAIQRCFARAPSLVVRPSPRSVGNRSSRSLPRHPRPLGSRIARALAHPADDLSTAEQWRRDRQNLLKIDADTAVEQGHRSGRFVQHRGKVHRDHHRIVAQLQPAPARYRACGPAIEAACPWRQLIMRMSLPWPICSGVIYDFTTYEFTIRLAYPRTTISGKRSLVVGVSRSKTPSPIESETGPFRP